MNHNNDMQTIIASRIKSIRQSHANNLIEGMDMGADALEGMIQHAREPISDEEFVAREVAMIQQRYPLKIAA